MGKKWLFAGLIAVAVVAATGLRVSGQWDNAFAWVQQTIPGVSAATAPAGDAKGSERNSKAAAGGAGGSSRRGPAPVEVAEAKAQTLRDSISAIGTLAAQESVTIAADAAGRIVKVLAQDGARVKVGVPLFELDGALLAAEMKDAEARLALAETTHDRNLTLLKTRTVPQTNVDQSKAELDLARSAVELVREKQSRLVVRAPFDGHLGFAAVSTGAYVTPGMALVALDQITTLKVSLSVPERYFTALSVGQRVSVSADAVPGKTFTANITAIDPVIDVNGRALRIQARLDNGALALRPGMLVRAAVMGEERKAVTVTEAAIVPQGRDTVVFAVEGGKAVRRVVETGQRRDGWVEITTGLAAGAQVVSAGATRLADGADVKPMPSTATE